MSAPLTQTQFIVQMIVAYARLYPGTTTECAMAQAATTFREFIADEKIEYGDKNYAWDASAAHDLISGYEGVVAETDVVAPGDTSLVSGVSSCSKSSTPLLHSDEMRERAVTVIRMLHRSPGCAEPIARAEALINDLIAALSTPQTPWRDIRDAPKDGTSICIPLVCSVRVFWSDDLQKWVTDRPHLIESINDPKLWSDKPLPTPPPLIGDEG